MLSQEGGGSLARRTWILLRYGHNGIGARGSTFFHKFFRTPPTQAARKKSNLENTAIPFDYLASLDLAIPLEAMRVDHVTNVPPILKTYVNS